MHELSFTYLIFDLACHLYTWNSLDKIVASSYLFKVLEYIVVTLENLMIKYTRCSMFMNEVGLI